MKTQSFSFIFIPLKFFEASLKGEEAAESYVDKLGGIETWLGV